jgi:single-stranded-DNA-specific exonuclease
MTEEHRMVLSTAFPSSASEAFLSPGDDARSLGRALSLTTTVAEWLLCCGHDDSDATRRFLEPRLAHLSDPGAMADRSVAADRLAHAIRRGERITVFGDYDCDGITSAAIMTEVLRALGGEVTPLLASRFDGGYGVSPAATERIVDSGATVLVTCDCGSSDHASLHRIAARGLDTIVIDHHLVPDEPLPAVAFLNPHRPDCGFAYKGLASCGLALSVGAALRAALGRSLDLRQWLDLVAIGTIADVAPLDGDNRALVRAGLARLSSAPRPGLRALAALAKVDVGHPLSAREVAFRIAPRLNAPGRLGPPDVALELLLARSDEAAETLAVTVDALSEKRKSIQEGMAAEAVAEIEREGWASRPAIVVGREGWSSGIVGIVAGRLADRYEKPVVVVGFDGGHGRGSVRGPRGIALYDALARCSDCLVRFGGHQSAAGLELHAARLGDLRDAFEAAVRVRSAAGEPSRPKATAVRLSADDAPARVLADIERLEPCGEANPSPRIYVEGKIAEAKSVKGGHLKLDLVLNGGQRLGCFGIGMGQSGESLEGTVALLGELRRDTWRGHGAVELFVEKLLPR